MAADFMEAPFLTSFQVSGYSFEAVDKLASHKLLRPEVHNTTTIPQVLLVSLMNLDEIRCKFSKYRKSSATE